ncbi:MAG: DNA primase catalytic subunit PriS, partial [Methanobacteriota archaeon]
MAAADPAKEATTHFLRDQFHRYYDTMKPTLPDRFGRREFGFMFWTPGIVQRHLGFSKEEELKAFLASRVPTHAYYSSAYYDNPNAPTMEEKGWLGADLIFDLDADHLPNAAKMSYPEMLEAIRLKIVHLYDDFLRSDFGFEEKAMRLVFSGGRGYHIHVFDERVWPLGSHERREIVDYITGKGLAVDSLFRESAFDKKEFQGHTRVKT